jgi:tetratricopeptide (TPR) repeat protein
MSVSALLVTRGNSTNITECLDHLSEVVSEFIVIGTSEAPLSLKEAAERGASLIHVADESDLLRVRNESFSRATQDWILLIHPEERLAPEDLGRIKKMIKSKKIDAYTFGVRRYTSLTSSEGFEACQGEFPDFERSYPGYHSSTGIRLIRRKSEPSIPESWEEWGSEQFHGRVENSDVILHNFGWSRDVASAQEIQELTESAEVNSVASEALESEAVSSAPKSGLEGEPSEAQAWRADVARAIERLRQGDLKGAIEPLRTANEAAPNNPVILSNFGYVLMETGELDEAERVLKDCIVLTPKFQDAWINLGVVEMKRKNWDKALRVFDNLLQSQPDSHVAYRNAGNCFVQKQKLKEAMACFNKAIQLAPDFSAPKIDLALICMAGRRYDLARRWLDEVFQKEPQNPRAKALLSQIEGMETPVASAKEN